MESLSCGRCGTSRDTDDNFCRTCGHQFTSSRLPAPRVSNLPERINRHPARGLPASFVGSVAVLAVGTGVEWAVRRFGSSAAKAAGRAIVRSDRTPAKAASSASDDISVDEVLYVRKVQLRR